MPSHARIRQIFVAVAALPTSDQEEALLRLCGNETDVLAEVRALLGVSPQTSPLMDIPTADPLNPAEAFRDAPLDEQPGSRIGAYKLIRQIGEGGFGSVFMAEQERPVRRTVALKIIKLGMDTRQVVARFEQERQALALMDHPNIAKVFDAGATNTGRPYFVMELCKGEPITAYCDRNNLSITDRLALFVQVCQAVQHAHQKGLIHRDIKPSNVLVSSDDGRASTKVIDFGIAKATASKLTEKTLFTEHRQMIGTPEYMSPEQAEGSMDIDTRTDVYALGVLLYELLIGSTPFDSQSLRSAAYDEIQRIIREVDPPAPSTRLSQNTATVANVAAQRRTEPKKLGTIIRGELDWIVMKAMEKDRQRRYDTANGLGLDIQRYLNDEAVIAAPPSRTYRFQKFIKRNKGSAIAASILAGVLVSGLVGTSYGLRQAVKARDGEATARMAAEREADRAVKAEAQTKARANELKKVADFQSQMLAQVDPTAAGVKLTQNVRTRFDAALTKAGVPNDQQFGQSEAFASLWSRVNSTDVARDLIDETILKPAITAIDRQFVDQPAVASALRNVLADRYHDLGIDATALSLEMRTLEQRRRVLGEEHPDTLISICNVGAYLSGLGRNKEAEPYYREALDKSRRVRGDDDMETLTCISNMGRLLLDENKLSEAEPYYREALVGRRRVLGELHEETLRSLNDWGWLLSNQGKFEEAETCCREALAKCRDFLGEEHRDTLRTTNELAVLLQKQGKLDEAATYFRELVDKRRRILGEVHPRTLVSIQNLGSVLNSSGHPGEAEELLREALTKQQRLLGVDHADTLTSLGNLSMLLIGQDKLTEAEAMCRETLERRRRVLGEAHPDTLIAINVLGLVLRRENKLAEAEPYIREMLATGRRVLGPVHPETLIYTHNLATFLQEQDKPDQAEALFREVIQKGGPAIGRGQPIVLSATQNLGGILLDQKRNPEAVELLAAAEPFARKTYAHNDESELGAFLVLLGRAQSRAGQRATAESTLLEAHAIYLKILGTKDTDTRRSAAVLGHFYSLWDEAEPGKGFDAKAAEWNATLEKLQAATRPEATRPASSPDMTAPMATTRVSK
jgi:eukaryotic-like serine/threonine-protein kinase